MPSQSNEVRPRPVLDFTKYDLIVFTPDHPDGISGVGYPDSSVGILESAWDTVEDRLFPARKTRLKWEMVKELFGGRTR